MPGWCILKSKKFLLTPPVVTDDYSTSKLIRYLYEIDLVNRVAGVGDL